MNRFWEWWHRRRNKPPVQLVAIATNTPEPSPEELNAAEISDPEFDRLATMFRNTVWARGQINEMLTRLIPHVYNEHADPIDCDAWCVPNDISRYLTSLSRHELIILYVVLMKSYLVLDVTHRQQQRGGSDT